MDLLLVYVFQIARACVSVHVHSDGHGDSNADSACEEGLRVIAWLVTMSGYPAPAGRSLGVAISP